MHKSDSQIPVVEGDKLDKPIIATFFGKLQQGKAKGESVYAFEYEGWGYLLTAGSIEDFMKTRKCEILMQNPADKLDARGKYVKGCLDMGISIYDAMGQADVLQAEHEFKERLISAFSDYKVLQALREAMAWDGDRE